MISRSFKPLDLLNKKSSILLLGPRGTGKTAILREVLSTYPHFIHIDLLRGNLFQRYVQAPHLLGDEIRSALSQSNESLLVAVDEIQKIPELMNEVHSLIEEHKNRIVFMLTGSSARKLRRGGANLLAGRALAKFLFPLNALELEIELNRALQFGTLPSVYLGNADHRIDTLDTYVSTYLREEIQQESLVRGIDRFARFLDFAGQLHAEPINFSKLGKQIGVAGKTAADYFGILVDTLVVHQLSGWSHSVKKQLLQAPKYYFFDCGVLNAINGYLRIDLKQNSFLYGKLFETFVINQLVAANEYLNYGARFYYWRDKHGAEVDLIIARNVMEPMLAIEIKSSPNPSPEDCSGFISFAEDYPQVRKICICTTPRAFSKAGIDFIPWQEAVRSGVFSD